jgi:hypothetical protein
MKSTSIRILTLAISTVFLILTGNNTVLAWSK